MTTAYDFFGNTTPNMADDAAQAEHHDTALWQVDLTTRQVWWNEAAQRLHGVGAKYHPNFDNAFEFCLPDQRETIRSELTNSMREATPWCFYYDADLPDGRRIRLENRGYPIRENGRAIKLMGQFALQEVLYSRGAPSPMTPPQ